jgi:hypothetical protein
LLNDWYRLQSTSTLRGHGDKHAYDEYVTLDPRAADAADKAWGAPDGREAQRRGRDFVEKREYGDRNGKRPRREDGASDRRPRRDEEELRPRDMERW